MERRVIEANGTRLAFLEAGEGPAVILLHALGRDADDWATVVAGLSGRYRCLAMDLPGHGEGRRQPPYTFGAMADDLAALATWLDEPYVLLAHSMGASVAWLHAMHRPRGLLGLVAEDTVLPRSGYDIPPAEPAPTEPVLYEWGARATIIDQLRSPDPTWWPGMGEVDVPCLLISGREGDPELSEAAVLIPRATYVEVPVGHWIHQEATDTYLHLVAGFLDEVAPTS